MKNQIQPEVPSKDNIQFGHPTWIGKNAVLTGKLSIGDYTSIWHNVVIRGDVTPIRIGKNCNIQDGSILHGQIHEYDVQIGNNVSIAHASIIHGSVLADNCFIGMGAMLMNGCRIGEHVFVAAGSLLSPGSIFEEPYTLVMGRPGKVVRKLKDEEIKTMQRTVNNYIDYAEQWLEKISN